MLERTFTYTDYKGNKQEDTFYFNLTEADLLEMNMGSFGGLDNLMKRLVREDRPKEIVAMFKEMILSSVGRISPDGRRFERNQAIRDDFYQTEAYSQLFTELVMDGEKLKNFLFAIVPDNIRAAAMAKEAEREAEEKGKLLELKPADGGEPNAEH